MEGGGGGGGDLVHCCTRFSVDRTLTRWDQSMFTFYLANSCNPKLWCIWDLGSG